MKHSLNILLVLVLFFLVSQIVGLFVVKSYVDVSASESAGKTVWKSLPSLGGVPFERPDVDPYFVPIYLLIGIVFGSLLVWLFSRIKYLFLWKLWFFSAMVLCLYISFSAFISAQYAFVLAFIFGALKVFRPSIIIHNFTEVFLYGGLCAIFIPLLNLFSAFSLIILISLYDIYAVWKSQHMISLAKFQMKAQLFAGLLIPYKLPKFGKQVPAGKNLEKAPRPKVRTAILGGGDIAFPLLFTGVVMQSAGFLQSLIISLCASIALFLLIYFGDKNKFYPAMPFIGAGCFVGYGIILLVNLL